MDKERALVSFNSDPETLEFLKESAKKNGFENMSDLLRSMVIDLKNMSSKQIPDWLYGGEVSKAELHRFAISLDKSDLDKDWKRRIVLTLYNELKPEQRTFIGGFTNEDSIFYVPIFREILGDLDEYGGYIRNIQELKKEIEEHEKVAKELDETIKYLEGEMEKSETRSTELEKSLTELQTQRDQLEKYNANLMSNDGIKKITEYLETVKGLVSAIEKTDKEKSSAGDLLYSERDRYLSAMQFKQLLELIKLANELENVLKSEDFISIENLDKKRQELKKQMDEVAKSNQTYAKNHLPVIDNKIKEILSSLYDDLEELVPGQMQRGGAQSKIAEAISLLDLSKSRKLNLFRLKGDA